MLLMDDQDSFGNRRLTRPEAIFLTVAELFDGEDPFIRSDNLSMLVSC
jgi:hypothetical protein